MIPNHQAYRVGYLAGRYLTKLIKIYVVKKLVVNTFSKTVEFSKQHKIDSKNAEVLTENVFQCLEYLE